MGIRLLTISLYLQTISFVSLYIEDGKMLQTHYFDFLSKNVGKREKFIIVLKQNNGEPSVIVWRILHICKTGVVGADFWFLLFVI